MLTAVLTISSAASRRETEDESGPLLAELAEHAGAEIVAIEVVSDDFALIEDRLHHYVDESVALILTTGGTGVALDDVTPEATLAVVDRLAPGFSEAMRAQALAHTAAGMLSRGVSGTAGRTLIINLPGSVVALRELFAVIAPALPQAVATLQAVRGSRGGH